LSYREKLIDITEETEKKLSKDFVEFYRIVKTLRAPGGCPWDRKQTQNSLSPNLIEEVYELIDALENRDIPNEREELGDIFLVLTMIGIIGEEENKYTLSEVLKEISEKLVRRHPHVFGDEFRESAEEVVELWNHIKKNIEKKGEHKESSIFDSIPRTMPPLERSYKIQKKAAKTGFDWEKTEEVFHKLKEEISELEETLKKHGEKSKHEEVEEEVGDLIFSIVNIARFLGFDPAIALNKTNKKFLTRFGYIEEKMREEGKELCRENFEIMDKMWEESKKM
jgi:tetrapyrrole methylase family protein/MazG family protein